MKHFSDSALLNLAYLSMREWKIELVYFDSDSWTISQAIVIEQQKSSEIVLLKESLYNWNIVIDMKKLLQYCPLVLSSI